MTLTTANTHRMNNLLSSACADALGACAEMKSPHQISREYGGRITTFHSGGVFGFEAGEATDDTQMTVATLIGIHAAGSTHDIPWKVLTQFQSWLAGNPRDVGGLTRDALSHKSLDGGHLAWKNSGFTAAGNGGLMRANSCYVAGMQDDDLVTFTAVTGALTHFDPRSVFSSVLIALMIDYAPILNAVHTGGERPLPGHLLEACFAECFMDLENRKEQITEVVGDLLLAPTREFQQQTKAALREIEHEARDAFHRKGHAVHQTGYVIHTLHAALRHASQGTSWLGCVQPAVHQGDDADTVACVTGMLAAARGFTVPEHLVLDLKIGATWDGWPCKDDLFALKNLVAG